MDVRVAGHQVDIGESLRNQAIGRMQSLAEKYFSRAVAANVTLSPGPHSDFVCDIVAPVAQGVVLKAHHRAPEAHLAFEGAGDKIEKQLRRYSKRLREHKGNGVDIWRRDVLREHALHGPVGTLHVAETPLLAGLLHGSLHQPLGGGIPHRGRGRSGGQKRARFSISFHGIRPFARLVGFVALLEQFLRLLRIGRTALEFHLGEG